MERQSFRQFAFDVLELFSTEAERVQATRDLIGRSHALENHAASFGCVTSAALGIYGSRLAEGLCNKQEGEKYTCDYEASDDPGERMHAFGRYEAHIGRPVECMIPPIGAEYISSMTQDWRQRKCAGHR